MPGGRRRARGRGVADARRHPNAAAKHFPRLLRRDVRWLATYVALSRVRRLKNLRSIGLSKDIRAIMEEGPPHTLPAQFHKCFSEEEAQTVLDANAAMIALGWT